MPAGGQEITGAQGSFGQTQTVRLRSSKSGAGSSVAELTGQSSTVAQGAFTKGHTRSVSGISGALAQGALTVSVPPSGAQTWAVRSTQPGVILALDFSQASHLGTINGAGRGWIAGSLGDGTQVHPSLDSSVSSHAGGGSLRFDVQSLSTANACGEWYTNFIPGSNISDPNFGAGQGFGPNSEYWVQWGQRVDQNMIDIPFRQLDGSSIGIKSLIVGHMDGPNASDSTPTYLARSDDWMKLVITTRGSLSPDNRFTVMYRDLNGSDPGFDTFIDGQLEFENGMPAPFCRYPDVTAGCFKWQAGVIDYYTLHVKLGSINTNPGPPHLLPVFENSEFELYITRPGQSRQLIHAWNATKNGYLRLQAIVGWKYGKLWFGPYMTNKDWTQAHATARMWITDVIVSSQNIADPIVAPSDPGQPALLPWAPAAGRYIELSGTNTMRDVYGSNPNARQNLNTVLDNWNSSIYASGDGTYGAIYNGGSGHDNFVDAIFRQGLSPVAADSDWTIKFPLSTYPDDFTENTGAGRSSPNDGAIDPPLYDSPTPPHNYDQMVYIPGSAFGNTKGAFCYALLSAIGTQATNKWYAWFLNLDNDPGTWSTSQNQLPANATASTTTDSSAVYDSTRQCIWYLNKANPTHIGKLQNLSSTRDWTSVAHGNGLVNSTGKLTGGYHPGLDCVVWWSSDEAKLIVWKPNAAGTSGTLTWNAAQAGTPPYITGLEWCPHEGVQKFYGMEYNYGGNGFGSLTISNGSPAVLTFTGYVMPAEGTHIWIDSTIAPPSPIQIGGAGYYVRNPSGNTCNISSSPSGSLINTTTAGSGAHMATLAYAFPRAKTLTPPASLPGTWTWGAETFTAQGGAGPIGNDSVQPRYNALRWVPAAKAFCWANRIDGPTNFFRPAAAS